MPSAPEPDSAKGTTTSGIAEAPNGQRHIPASTRADGSVRKEIRVRPGYRPPEDVEVYKNRTAEAWKNRGKGGVPGASFVESPKPKKPAQAKPKEASTPKPQDNKPEEPPKDPEPIDPEVEKQKEARKLSKKLRQARELQQKKDKGDALLPEQFEKVIRISELIRQLDKLGFDQEGQAKPDP